MYNDVIYFTYKFIIAFELEQKILKYLLTQQKNHYKIYL